MPSDPAATPALSVFALGHVDASLSILKLLPDGIRDTVETILAFRLLSKLWIQYRIDCGINQGRTLSSPDNGYELRVFTALVDEVCDWAPLRSASSIVRSNAPALAGIERQLYDDEIEHKLPLLLEVSEQVDRLTADMDPIRRAGFLIDRCQKLDEVSDYGICWALNLVIAFHMKPLGMSKASVPFPALFRRELLRFDRSQSWRDGALVAALAESAHKVSAAIFDCVHSKSAFDGAFGGLRRNSRLGPAHIYLCGMGEISPSLLARLIGCSEPGARKMLNQLVEAGFATRHRPSPAFVRSDRFRLGWSGAAWLRSFSISDAPLRADHFDD